MNEHEHDMLTLINFEFTWNNIDTLRYQQLYYWLCYHKDFILLILMNHIMKTSSMSFIQRNLRYIGKTTKITLVILVVLPTYQDYPSQVTGPL